MSAIMLLLFSVSVIYYSNSISKTENQNDSIKDYNFVDEFEYLDSVEDSLIIEEPFVHLPYYEYPDVIWLD